MSKTTRHETIRSAVRDMSAPEPDTDSGMWYRPSRNDANYWRYTPDGDEEPAYDVYLRKENRLGDMGAVVVSAEVGIFDVQGQIEIEHAEESVFRFVFEGHQPQEQTFLNNVPTYKEQINEAFKNATETAVLWSGEDNE